MNEEQKKKSLPLWRAKLNEIIFGTETPAGRAFDLVLLWMIVASVLMVILESVAPIRQDYGEALRLAEWIFTGLFTMEYVLRLICIQRPGLYAKSFFGVIDLLSFLPTYLTLFVAGGHSILVIRAVRLLRIFRILKLGRYIQAANVLLSAIRNSWEKILVFLGAVVSLVLIIGTAMYLIEGEANGFTSIPRAMYWAIVTMTTVGYGDIAPQTILGQILASIVMILGYSIIAVPTGFVAVDIAQEARNSCSGKTCRACGLQGHQADAVFCRKCAGRL